MKIEGPGIKAVHELVENTNNKSSDSGIYPKSFSHEMKLSDFVQTQPVSVRVRNAILSAEKNDKLIIKTLKEYMENQQYAKTILSKLDNMGLKSIQDLDFAINDYIRTPEGSHTKFYGLQSNTSVELEISLEKFVSIYPVNIRIKNAIKAATEESKLGIQSIKSYIENPIKSKIELKTIENLGLKSIVELESAIIDYCLNDTKQNQNESVNIHHNFIEIIESILSNKEISILKLRSLASKTLEDVGIKFGVTRERIRQIERGAIRKLSKQLKLPLEKFSIKLDQDLDDSYGEIGLNDILDKYNTSGLEFKFIVYISGNFFKEKIAIKNKLVYRVSNTNNFLEWNNIIDDCLYSSFWPIEMERLKKELIDIPETYLTRYLLKKRKATIENGVIKKLDKISQEARVAYILRYAGKPLQVSEIVQLFKSMFELEINEHNARSIVGRMDNALIVDRGIYALYETFGLTDEFINFVRYKSQQYLLSKNIFISSKVIYKDVFKSNEEFKLINNEYVLHGILQDDDRFHIKRGLMVGLLEYGGEVEHIPLTNEIYRLVVERGPISVTEIKDLLSRHRKILSVTVSMMLNKYPDVVKISPGQFATIEFVFKSEENFEDFLVAIKIALINKKMTLYHLITMLRSLDCFDNIEITKSLVSTSITKIDNVIKEGEIYSLSEIDGDLDKYNSIINNLLSEGMSASDVKDELNRLYDFSRLDYRLVKDGDIHDVELGSKNNEISSIFQAFGI